MVESERSQTILVVDKFDGIHFVLEGVLKPTHAKPIFCNTVRQSIAVLDVTEVSLVISGYYLNDGTGMDVLRYLRQHKGAQEIPFILYTNLAQGEVPHVSYLPFHYVHKSKFKELAQTVSNLLGSSSTEGVS